MKFTNKLVFILCFIGILSFSMVLGHEGNRQRSIDWSFFTYESPDFRSEITGRFNPQVVTILETSENGWALINTYRGPSWVNLNGNLRFIPNATALYEDIGDESFTYSITPQVVRVLDEQENWLLIYTWLGPKWINLNFVPPTEHLDNLLRQFGNDLSVHFENLETGFIYRYNADRTYFSASVTKASFALYLYMLAENGEISLNEVHTFTEQDFMEGSGIIIDNHNVGATFTTRELLRLNLSESDNIATNILRRVYGIGGYRQFISDIGGTPAFVGNTIMNSRLTADEAGFFAREIFNFITSDARYSDEFKTHLLNNQFPFIVSDYPVASKTGWTRPIAWHDMAIVFASSPYTLTILSSRDGWTPQDYRDFEEISKAFQAFNNKWF